MTSDNPTPDEPLPDWEHELAELLSMLSESQGDLLQLLEEKLVISRFSPQNVAQAMLLNHVDIGSIRA